jgi:MFS family permease
MKSKLLGHSANDLFWFILPLVLPALLSRYELSYAGAGGILTVYLLFTAVGSFVMGKISDYISRKQILSSGFLLAAAGLISAGFAPSLPVFLLLISITAIGMSTFHPVMYAVLDETYPERKSRVMALYECFGTAAILLMFLVNGFLIGRIGVRGVLILTAVPALIMSFVYRFTDSIPDAAPVSKLSSAGKFDRSMVVRFILFLLSVILRVFSVTALLNFLPTIFANFFGLEPGRAAYATAFYFAGGLSGSLIVGRLSERFNSFRIILVGTVFIGFTMIILAGSLPVWFYIIIVTLFGGFSSGCIINQNLLIARLGGRLGRGEVFGILMGTMTVTSALSPAFFGLVIDSLGYRQALGLFTIPLLLSIVILTYLLKTDRVTGSALNQSL